MSNITNNFDNLPEELVEVTGIQKPRPVKEFLQSYYKTLGDGKQELLGIRTGIEELDRKTLGLDGLMVLGGIAGQGKTSLALQIAFSVCELETPAIFYSLEMSRRAILTKILSRLALVKYEDIILKGRYYLDETVQYKNLLNEEIEFNRLLSKDQINGLNNAKERLNKASDKFYLRTRENQEPDINLESVEQEINLVKAEHGTDKVMVVIDHLQVFNLENYKDQIDKENKLITGFKGISERTGAAILLISQKNKAGFTTRGLQTIKGSVDIVYLADIVMFLEKENNGNDLDTVIASYGNTNNRQIDLIIDKNRYNAPGKIELDFNGEYSSFTVRRK